MNNQVKNMKCLMGIDIGTSSTRAVVIDLDGHILAIGQKEYSFDIPHEGWAEQEPEDWWNAVKYCVHEIFVSSSIVKEDIISIGFSGQMHGLVPLRRNGTVVRKAILWCDQRSKNEVLEIEKAIGKKRLVQLVRSPVATGFMLPSLLWMKKHEPAFFAETEQVILPKDFVRYKMTGIIASEITDAASTTALDCNTNKWSSEIITGLDLPMDVFPLLGNPETVAGNLTAIAAKELGLQEGIPVAYGGADQVMQALGNGVNKPGTALVTIGTGGQILMPLDFPVYDYKLSSHCFSFVEDKSYYMGASLAAGLSLKWIRNTIAPEESYSDIDKKVKALPAGANGLVFLPYITGDRTPHMDPDARGLLFGTTIGHTKYHFFRAVMEGVVFSLRDCKDVLEQDLCQKIDCFVASGGGAQSKVWLQMQADILNAKIYTSRMKEQSAVGAAICAGLAVGAYDSYKKAFERVICWNEKPVIPRLENVRIYNKLFDIYKGLYDSTKDYMHQLGRECLAST